MSNNHVISGNVSTEDLQNALSAFYGDKRKIVIINDNDKDKDNGEEDGAASTENDSESNNIDKDNNTNVYININKCNQLSSLLKEKTEELTKLEKTSAKELVDVHVQQKQLFDEFVILRTRYDEQKTQLMETLWDKCSVSHPELSEIPKCENELLFLEDEDRVGIYDLGEVLGEGQFALVRSCNISHSRGIEYAAIHETHDLTREYAMKILSKERLLTFHSLKRVSNEIKILRALDSKYIVKTMDVIQTKKKLYIVTEKGGEDLFKFFDEHPKGVPVSWAKDIARCILRGVQYCHQAKICHRDLKPENILLKFDVDNGVCEDLKLCDFGLASEYKSTEPFTDFCGSPGFFAPEMITRGSYFGDKVDIWSCGCILLELVLSHDKFCEIWMVAYDYEVMQEKDQFSNEINTTLRKLMSTLDFSNDFNDFIMNFLRLKPSNRTSIAKLLTHRWLELDEEEKLYYQTISTVRSSASPLTVNDGVGRHGRNRTQSGNLDLSTDIGATGPPIQSPDLSRSSSGQVTGHTDTELLKQAFHNQSEKSVEVSKKDVETDEKSVEESKKDVEAAEKSIEESEKDVEAAEKS
ncbi:protein kinase, partial [Akkermansiaceae bacterium]|nr:protein kinase [Akkermansiaceae bacterium]